MSSPYVKTTWVTGDVVTQAKANNWETQYDCVLDSGDKAPAGNWFWNTAKKFGWADGYWERVSANVAKFWNGTTVGTIQAALAESYLTFTDITTGNVSTAAHGFVPKAPNDTSKFLRGDATWGSIVLSIASYAVTVANVLNTTTKTAFISFVIPAGAMSDGDSIFVRGWSLEKNNSGGSVTATWELSVGAGTPYTVATTWADDSTEYTNTHSQWFMRQGANLCYLNGNTPGINMFNTQNGTASSGIVTPTNFTGAITVTLSLTFSAANALTYTKPQAYGAFHFKR